MGSHFFAMISRMKYIERWALMRNSEKENISEHSLEVAMIAHALAVLGNRRLGRSYNADRAALIGIYHDANEIINILDGNTCGTRPTSCADQFAKALKERL